MGIFYGLKFFLVPGLPEKTRLLIIEEAGQIIDFVLGDPTHIISDSYDCPEIAEANDCLQPNSFAIVKTSWISLSVRSKTLLPVKAFSPEPNQLFSGITFCLSEITPNDATILWCAVESYGGRIVTKLDKETRLVCGKASGKKYETAEEERLTIVTPDWISDSIRNQSLMPVNGYHPKLLLQEQQFESDLNSTDESMIVSLLNSEFGEMIHNELESARAFESPAAAMDSLLSASLNAVIAQSMQSSSKRSVSHMESAGSHQASESESMGFTSSVELSSANKMMAQNSTPALVRPQTKTALAKLLNTRLGGTQQDPSQVNMVSNIPLSQGAQMSMNQQQSMVSMQQQMSDPGQIQLHVNQQQQWQQWQQKQQQLQQQQFVNMQSQNAAPGMQMVLPNQSIPQQQHLMQPQINLIQQQQMAQQNNQQMYQIPPNQQQMQPNQQQMQYLQQQLQQQQHQQQFAMTNAMQNPQQIQQHRQQITIGHQQTHGYPQQMPIRQPPPYQQVVRPVQMMQRIDLTGQQPNQQQFQQQHSQVVSPGLPMPPEKHCLDIMNQQRMQQPQMIPRSVDHPGPGQMQPPRPVLQMQVSMDGKPASFMGRMGTPKELVYVGTDCPNLPPAKFLSGSKFTLLDMKELSDMDSRTWKNIEATIKKYGGTIIPPESMVAIATHFICENQSQAHAALQAGKRVVTLYWLNDCYRKGQMLPPWRFTHIPTSFGVGQRPLQNKLVTVTGFHDDEREDVIALLLVLGAKYQPFLNRDCSLLVSKSSSGKKFAKALEWKIPAVNVVWLHDVWQCIPSAIEMAGKEQKYLLFNYDAPLDVGPKALPVNFMAAWLNPVQIPADQQTKLVSTKGRPINAQNPKKKIKKQMMDNECKKKRKLGPVVVLFDGIEKSEENKLTKNMKGPALGVSITEKFHVCTHLVACKAARTPRFLITFSSCKYIVSPKWIEDSVTAEKVLDPEPYVPQDQESETRDGFSLRESMERKAAMEIAGTKVLTNFQFYVTPRVYPQIDTLSEIIDAAGGKTFKHQMPRLEEIVSNGKNGVFFVIIGTVADYKDLHFLIKTGHPIYSAEFVFSSIIKQKVDWGANRLDFSSMSSEDVH